MKINLPNLRKSGGKKKRTVRSRVGGSKKGVRLPSLGGLKLPSNLVNRLPFKVPVSRSPISVHFGSMDTRILQLDGGPGAWRVTASECLPAQGRGRHTAVAEDLAPRVASVGLKGKDCVIGLSGKDVAISRVPLDEHNRQRMAQVLKETAARAVQDPEGVLYRYLPLTGDEAEEEATGTANAREEYLLMSVGQSEIRRCNAAAQTLQWRPVGIEAGAFPLARALQAVQQDEQDAWGFLHLGFGHSMFGIVHGGELGFLKPMQTDGERLFATLDGVLQSFDESSAGSLQDLITGGGEEEDSDGGLKVDAQTVMTLNHKAIGHATELLQALRVEAQTMSQEVRACVRHFTNRHHGARLSSVFLTGFGAGLPEVENALGNALDIPTSVARPFTALGIDAPDHVFDDEHMWCGALGLAIRGF